MSASEWEKAHSFYTQRLGMRPRNRDGHWAVFGAGWDAYVTGRSRGLVFELFEGGGSAPPAIALGLQIRDLDGAVEKLHARGVPWIAMDRFGTTNSVARFQGPAGVQWSLIPMSTARFADGLLDPEILRVELKVADAAGQIAFYHQVLGLPRISPNHVGKRGNRGSTQVPLAVFCQHSNGPELVMLPGGRRHEVEPRWKEEPALGQKVFLGFMTPDISKAAQQLQAAQVQILHDVEHHAWGGTDLIVADADGNAVQIFALDTDHRFGSAPSP